MLLPLVTLTACSCHESCIVVIQAQYTDQFFQVIERVTPLKVELYCPPLSKPNVSSRHPSTIAIENSSSSRRYGSDSFYIFDIPPRTLRFGSPRKRPTNILKRWQEALEKMTEEEAQTNDGFPASISALPASSKSPKKGKRSASKSPSFLFPPPSVPFDADEWSPSSA